MAVGDLGRELVEPLCSAPDARASFLLRRQKKRAKEKATPGRRPACGGVPCATQGDFNTIRSPLRSVFLLPSAPSSSAGRNGKRGEDCLRGAAPSSAAPRCARAAQRTRRSRATQRARVFFGYFLLARQKKVPRLQAKHSASAPRPRLRTQKDKKNGEWPIQSENSRHGRPRLLTVSRSCSSLAPIFCCPIKPSP